MLAVECVTRKTYLTTIKSTNAERFYAWKESAFVELLADKKKKLKTITRRKHKQAFKRNSFESKKNLD